MCQTCVQCELCFKLANTHIQLTIMRSEFAHAHCDFVLSQILVIFATNQVRLPTQMSSILSASSTDLPHCLAATTQ